MIDRRAGGPRPLALLASLALIAGCGDDTTEPAVPPVPVVHVVGLVTDPDGTPVPGVAVRADAGPFAEPDETLGSYTHADATGRYELRLGAAEGLELDSLALDTWWLPCSGVGNTRLVLRPVQLREAEHDTLEVDIAMARTSPVALLRAGPACAIAYSNAVLDVKVQLWFDVVEPDRVAGRWQITYRHTRPDDFGYFSGAQEGELLTLNLSRMPDGTPDGTTCEYVLTVPVESNDVLGTGSYESTVESCEVYSTELRFSELEWRRPAGPITTPAL